jgi:hypothetical protein
LGFGSVEYNGYLYILGGGHGLTKYNDVQYAPLNSNGTIGTWANTTAINLTRSFANAVAYNGYLYIIGGYSGGYLADVERAPINANGTLGDWSQTAAYSTGRQSPSSVIYNGYLYVGAGTDGAELGDTQYASLNVIPRTGHYSKLIDLGSTGTLSSITYTGLLQNGLSDIAYKAWDSSGTTLTGSGLVSSLSGGGGKCATGGISAEYVLLNVTLDDGTQNAVFPDANATNNANVQDLTVNYTAGATHPPPNERLHLGKILQTGTLSPLDTCGV